MYPGSSQRFVQKTGGEGRPGADDELWGRSSRDAAEEEAEPPAGGAQPHERRAGPLQAPLQEPGPVSLGTVKGRGGGVNEIEGLNSKESGRASGDHDMRFCRNMRQRGIIGGIGKWQDYGVCVYMARRHQCYKAPKSLPLEIQARNLCFSL